MNSRDDFIMISLAKTARETSPKTSWNHHAKPPNEITMGVDCSANGKELHAVAMHATAEPLQLDVSAASCMQCSRDDP